MRETPCDGDGDYHSHNTTRLDMKDIVDFAKPIAGVPGSWRDESCDRHERQIIQEGGLRCNSRVNISQPSRLWRCRQRPDWIPELPQWSHASRVPRSDPFP